MERKKSISTGYTLYGSIYIEFSRDEFIVMKTSLEFARGYNWGKGVIIKELFEGGPVLFA